MGCNKICRTCEYSDTTRIRGNLVRCLKKHKFVLPTGSCELHSFHISMDDEKLKELMKEFRGQSNEKI